MMDFRHVIKLQKRSKVGLMLLKYLIKVWYRALFPAFRTIFDILWNRTCHGTHFTHSHSDMTSTSSWLWMLSSVQLSHMIAQAWAALKRVSYSSFRYTQRVPRGRNGAGHRSAVLGRTFGRQLESCWHTNGYLSLVYCPLSQDTLGVIECWFVRTGDRKMRFRLQYQHWGVLAINIGG